ncbi:LuxR C-terminal-related transcriptional regulator [Pseudonocardia hydrocarbonoxydans]|uniref:DNA-binding response regulator n=1 Tax=Pseudonocardia hydrocarbonoxydans TaxID=76726 RepID=A0A4Y3WTS1_9PSEU|nr:response regulator transcription factor [Pseudonocardia hydrocarbonoxydans]GEC20746.1 hypothetical protein PHY01_30290 [Pseudonocardia hydrocarbonoxydans]
MTTVPVTIVDDHQLVGVALTAALRAHGIRTRYVDPTADPGLPAALDDDDPGLVVLDLDLGPGPDGASIDGVDLVPRVRATGRDVLLLTGSRDRPRIAAAVAAGALGWLAKSLPFDEIVATIAATARGEHRFDPGPRSALVAEHHAAAGARRELDRRWSRLTPREREVLARLVDGRRVADVAREFVVAEATVRTQVRSILAKLEVRSQLEAVAVARTVG